jgi:hypothetical protein
MKIVIQISTKIGTQIFFKIKFLMTLRIEKIK